MSSIAGKCKSIDQYGHSIGVHYRGDGSYRTILGSIVTLIALGFVMVYTTIRISGLVKRTSQNESTQFLRVDLDEIGQVSFVENDFTISYYASGTQDGKIHRIPTRIGKLKPYL